MEKLKSLGRWLAKNILPWLALALGATTDAVGEHLLNIPNWVGSLILSGAGALGIAGISPFPVTPTLARLFGFLSAGAAAILVGHGLGQIWPPPTAHVILFHVIGSVGVLLGVIGGRQGARAVLGKPPIDQPPSFAKT